ncbi:MAG: lactonase family protein [Chitinophagaceae bacterium]
MRQYPLTFLLLFFFGFRAVSQEYYLFVGTYDSPKSEGIYVYKFSGSDGSATAVSSVRTSNPSYLAVSPDEKMVYAVNENGDSAAFAGAVSAFSFDKSAGQLTLINQQPSLGNNPCYISVDKSGKWIFAGNYSSGNMVILPVREDGSLGPVKMNQPYTGSGPNKDRQLSSHVHCTILAGNDKDLFVTDLGSDKVNIEHFHAKTGFVFDNEHKAIQMEPGAGPRHLAIDDDRDFIYVIEELTGYVSVYTYPEDGNAQFVQRVRITPDDYTGKVSGADIHLSPDGRYLYTSCRGDANVIGIYAVDKKKGTLTLKGFQPTLGKTPRNFNFDPDGKFLLVANQNSDEIVIFKRDTRTGLLKDTGNRISVGKPVCIKWAETD